jgi:hypothetical protein
MTWALQLRKRAKFIKYCDCRCFLLTCSVRCNKKRDTNL